jgi:3D (Asp-Asp-Asp) domain-containing protein
MRMRRPSMTVTLIAVVAIAIIMMSIFTPSSHAASKQQSYKAKATWYAYGTYGAGGKLKDGDVALTNGWRKAHGIKYGDRIYIQAPKKYGITGWHRVMDTGCGYRSGKPTVDFWYRSSAKMPKAFRRAGVVNVKITRIKRS